MTWIIFISIVVILAVLGVISSKKEKKQAPEKLRMAKDAHLREDYMETLRLLSGAFYVPINNKYKPEDAKIALEAILLLDKVLEEQGMEKGLLTIDLVPALNTAALHGGEVPERLTKPVCKFLEKAENGTPSAISAFIKQIEKGGVMVTESEDQESDFTDEITDDSSREIMNKVGKFILKGKLDSAIELINNSIDNADDALKATLLDQRAACYFMKKEYNSALNDYKNILEFYPDNMRICSSIAETYEKMENLVDAKKYAELVMEKSKTKDYIKIAEKILSS